MARKESKTVNRKREQVRHRRVLPRLAALTGWLVAMALALSLLLAGAGYLIYRNLTETVNLVFAELVDGQEVTVGGISFPKPGRMRIDDVRMRDPEGAGDWLEVAEVEIDYDWEDLKKHRHIKSLRLKRPVLRIDEGVVDSLKKTGVANWRVKIINTFPLTLPPAFPLALLRAFCAFLTFALALLSTPPLPAASNLVG